MLFTYHRARKAEILKKQGHGMLESLDERLCLHMKAAGWRVVPLFSWRETNKQGIQLMNVNRDSEEKVTYIFFLSSM